MRRTAVVLSSGLLFATACFLLGFSGGCGGSSGSSQGTGTNNLPSGKIQHVIVIVQENRTPDNLFHGLPNADIANSGVNSHGQTIALQPASLAGSYDLGHKH